MCVEGRFSGETMTAHDHEFGSVERVVPRPRQTLTPEEIKDKVSGNFLFSFGFAGSGKTTLNWMMMNYLMNEGPFLAEIRVPDSSSGSKWGGRQLINSWKTQWIEGRFPEANQTGEEGIREVSLDAKTTKGKKLKVEFSFLEVSGELLKKVMPEPEREPELSPLLRAYFENPRLKFVVMLMLSPDVERNPDVEKNDQLFSSFVSYLKHEFPEVCDRMSLGVIVTNPVESLRRLQKFGSSDGRHDYLKFDEEALRAYVNRFCGETYQIWENWQPPKKTLLSPLHLGEIETMEGRAAASETGVPSHWRDLLLGVRAVHRQATGADLVGECDREAGRLAMSARNQWIRGEAVFGTWNGLKALGNGILAGVRNTPGVFEFGRNRNDPLHRFEDGKLAAIFCRRLTDEAQGREIELIRRCRSLQGFTRAPRIRGCLRGCGH